MMSCVPVHMSAYYSWVEESRTRHTFSTSPRAYICRAVRLDIQMGSMFSGGPWSIVAPLEFEPFSILIRTPRKRFRDTAASNQLRTSRYTMRRTEAPELISLRNVAGCRWDGKCVTARPALAGLACCPGTYMQPSHLYRSSFLSTDHVGENTHKHTALLYNSKAIHLQCLPSSISQKSSPQTPSS